MLPPLHCFGYCYQLLILYGHTIQNVKIHFSHRPFVVGAFVWFYSPQYCCYLIFFFFFSYYTVVYALDSCTIFNFCFFTYAHTVGKFLLIPAATQPQYCLTQQQMNIKQNKKKPTTTTLHTHIRYMVWARQCNEQKQKKKLAIDRSNPHHTIANAVVVVLVVVVAFNTTSHMNLHTNTLNLQHSTR